MIKALFLDLDGTLLSSHKTLLPSTIQALRRCKQQGVKVFMATARSPRLAQKLGLSREEIAVFGDDLNDVEMLSHCPNSVAMGNAHPQAKAVAAHVTHSCDEDGIAHALRNILHVIP